MKKLSVFEFGKQISFPYMKKSLLLGFLIMFLIINPIFSTTYQLDYNILLIENHKFQGNFSTGWTNTTLNSPPIFLDFEGDGGLSHEYVKNLESIMLSLDGVRICQRFQSESENISNMNYNYTLINIEMANQGEVTDNVGIELLEEDNTVIDSDYISLDNSNNRNVTGILNITNTTPTKFCILIEENAGIGYEIGWDALNISYNLEYTLIINSPENAEFPSISPIFEVDEVPIEVISSISNTFEYRLDYWTIDTWINVCTDVTDCFFTLNGVTEGSRTISIRDTNENTINASFVMDLMPSIVITKFEVNGLSGRLQGNVFWEASILRSDSSRGITYEIQLWDSTNNVLVDTNFVNNPQERFDSENPNQVTGLIFGTDYFSEGNIDYYVKLRQIQYDSLNNRYTSAFNSSYIQTFRIPEIDFYNNGIEIFQGFGNIINDTLDNSMNINVTWDKAVTELTVKQYAGADFNSKTLLNISTISVNNYIGFTNFTLFKGLNFFEFRESEELVFGANFWSESGDIGITDILFTDARGILLSPNDTTFSETHIIIVGNGTFCPTMTILGYNDSVPNAKNLFMSYAGTCSNEDTDGNDTTFTIIINPSRWYKGLSTMDDFEECIQDNRGIIEAVFKQNCYLRLITNIFSFPKTNQDKLSIVTELNRQNYNPKSLEDNFIMLLSDRDYDFRVHTGSWNVITHTFTNTYIDVLENAMARIEPNELGICVEGSDLGSWLGWIICGVNNFWETRVLTYINIVFFYLLVQMLVLGFKDLQRLTGQDRDATEIS